MQGEKRSAGPEALRGVLVAVRQVIEARPF
jgi:hypothetical protein